MGATRWNEYRPQIEAEYERIRKEDPELAAAVYDIFKPSRKIIEKDDATWQAWQAQWGSTKKRLMARGMSDAEAQRFMMLGRNVHHAGDKPIDDLVADENVVPGSGMPGGLPQLIPADQLGNDDAAKDVIRADLDKFIKEMMGPVSPTDPIYQQLIQGGTDAAQASAGAAGLSGRSGLAGTQAASVAQQNVAPYMAQRASLGLQAQGLRSNHELGLEGLAQGWEKINMGKADAAWASEQNSKQAAMGAIGTTLGTLGSLYGLPVTPTMGGQFGAGLASIGDKGPQYSSGPNYSTRNTYKPRKGGNGEGF